MMPLRATWQSPRARWSLIVAAFAVMLGVALRLSHFTDPYLVDFHAWRQADTAGFAHGYLSDSLNPLDPSLDRQPCAQRDAPFGRVESEWPGAQWLSVLPLAALGVSYPPAWYLRLWSIGWFLLTCSYLALLVRRLDRDPLTAALSVLAFAVFPLSIFFTRTVQPDGPALCFGVALLFHLDSWMATDPVLPARRRAVHALASVLFAALLLLTKVSNAFFALPALHVAVQRAGLWGALRKPSLWLAIVGALVPVVLWYRHARDYAWSFGIWADGGTSKFTNEAFFRDPEVWKRLANRQVYEVLTWAGLALLLLGLWRARTSASGRLASVWLLSVVLFVVATLRGNNRHIYYELPIVLPAAIFVAHGIQLLLRRGWGGIVVLAVAGVVHGAITYETLWGDGKRLGVIPYFAPVPELIEGIELIRRHVPEGERFVSSDRHPALYYNSARRGFYADQRARNLLRCAEGITQYLLLDRRARGDMQNALRKKPQLRPHLREVAAGRSYFVWTYQPPPRRPAKR